MAIVWHSQAGINQLLTLSGSPTSFRFQVLSIASGFSGQLVWGMSWEPYPGGVQSSGISNAVTVRIEDASGTVVQSNFVTTTTGNTSIGDVIYVGTGLVTGGGIWIQGTFTDATELFVGVVAAAIDDTALSSSDITAGPRALTTIDHFFEGTSGANTGTTDLTTFAPPPPPSQILGVQTSLGFDLAVYSQQYFGNANFLPSGYTPSFLGGHWSNIEQAVFDPYNFSASGSSVTAIPSNPWNVTVFTAGSLTEVYVVVMGFTVTASGIGSNSVLDVTSTAFNSSGTTLDSQLTTTLSTGQAFYQRLISAGAGGPIDHVSFQILSTTFPNVMHVQWQARAYRNKMGLASGGGRGYVPAYALALGYDAPTYAQPYPYDLRWAPGKSPPPHDGGNIYSVSGLNQVIGFGHLIPYSITVPSRLATIVG